MPKTVERKPPTKPISPKFTQRIRKEKVPKDSTEMVTEFKKLSLSKPVPSLPKKIPPKVTVPRSPNFTTHKRVHPGRTEEKIATKAPSPFKARPVPKFDKVFKPVMPHAHTTPKKIRLAENCKTEVKRQKTEITNPLNNPSRPATSVSAQASLHVTPRPSTVPRPPHLQTDQRSNHRLSSICNKENEVKPNVHPVMMKKSERPLTRPRSPKLSTTLRSPNRTVRQK